MAGSKPHMSGLKQGAPPAHTRVPTTPAPWARQAAAAVADCNRAASSVILQHQVDPFKSLYPGVLPTAGGIKGTREHAKTVWQQPASCASTAAGATRGIILLLGCCRRLFSHVLHYDQKWAVRCASEAVVIGRPT